MSYKSFQVYILLYDVSKTNEQSCRYFILFFDILKLSVTHCRYPVSGTLFTNSRADSFLGVGINAKPLDYFRAPLHFLFFW